MGWREWKGDGYGEHRDFPGLSAAERAEAEAKAEEARQALHALELASGPAPAGLLDRLEAFMWGRHTGWRFRSAGHRQQATVDHPDFPEWFHIGDVDPAPFGGVVRYHREVEGEGWEKCAADAPGAQPVPVDWRLVGLLLEAGIVVYGGTIFVHRKLPIRIGGTPCRWQA